MRIGLKTRLIIAFVSIIVLPIIVSIGFIAVFAASVEESVGQDGDELDKLFSDVKTNVGANSENLDHPDVFYNNMIPLLSKYDISISVFSPEGEELFSSLEYEKESNTSYFLKKAGALDVDVPANDWGTLSVKIQANSFAVPPFKDFKDILTAILSSVGMGLLVLVSLIALWTWYISKTILHPLKKIYTATEEVIVGNLDYQINYYKNDEIGRFVKGFDLMRHHLKTSIEQQHHYEKARKELIASISHDLRTPLSSIRGYVEGLEDGIAKTEEMQKKYLRVIKSKTDQLDRLIEDLFEFSRFELEQLSIEKKLVNSSDFFQEAFHTAQLDFQQAHVEFMIDGPIPSASLHLDTVRMKQVMANLFDNTIRYGGNKVVMKIVKLESHIQVSIMDNGQGIADEDIPFIFNTFYRGEKSRSRELGGTGLGLAIVKYIIHAHEGEIKVESQLGKGSEFIFTLPKYLR